jgi:hypothetical protein
VFDIVNVGLVQINGSHTFFETPECHIKTLFYVEKGNFFSCVIVSVTTQ